MREQYVSAAFPTDMQKWEIIIETQFEWVILQENTHFQYQY